MNEKIKKGKESKTLKKIRSRSSSKKKKSPKKEVLRLPENVMHIEIGNQKFSVDAIKQNITPLNRVKGTQFPEIPSPLDALQEPPPEIEPLRIVKPDINDFEEKNVEPII